MTNLVLCSIILVSESKKEDLNMENNPAIGTNALEFIDSLLTPKEKAESEARVAIIARQIEQKLAREVEK